MMHPTPQLLFKLPTLTAQTLSHRVPQDNKLAVALLATKVGKTQKIK
jgi:hypothetical protein